MFFIFLALCYLFGHYGAILPPTPVAVAAGDRDRSGCRGDHGKPVARKDFVSARHALLRGNWATSIWCFEVMRSHHDRAS